MPKDFCFTSESVAEGHPDKVADQISDAILDEIIAKDTKARVDCETLVMQGMVVVTGQITTKTYIDIPKVVRSVLMDIGFDDSKVGIDAETCGILNSITEQSPDIAIGVNKEDQGAGDQGIMFGYATKETPSLMPISCVLAHGIVKRLAEVRRNGTLPYLRPDGKSQVTVEYKDWKPKRVDAVVIAAQHDENVSLEKLRKDITERVIREVVPRGMIDDRTRIIVNGTGRFVIGGTLADSGLTGRKTVVDSYGGWGRTGGGCFSGKDPSKVDRSGSYMARYIAKNIVAAGLAERCEIELAYAIGISEPVSSCIETFGTGKVRDEEILAVAKRIFPLKPRDMIDMLNLLRPIYRKTAVYGHFGRDDPDFTWERVDKVDELLEAFANEVKIQRLR
jgi:S-adenosylmethionine synthetase